jgi:choline monooxygenase
MKQPTVEEIIGTYNAAAPLQDASTIPAAWYVDPRIAELERQTVFSRTWQVIGHADQLRAPGDFITATVANEPIVAVRGADNGLRAFFNVCRHHAAAVATEAAGNASVLRCPYHGWTYGLDGSLKGVPEFDGVCQFDRGANGLVPTRVETWESFVLVNLDPAAPPLNDFLGSLAARVQPLKLSQLHFVERRTYALNCNWKVYVDNYLDGGYHVPHLHKSLNSVLDYVEYTIENQDRFCLQSSPIRSSGGDDVTAAVRQGRAYYFWQYPNFMFNVYEGVMDTNLVLPLGVDRTAVVFDFYFSDVDESSHNRNKQSIDVGERIQDEDVAICESVHRGLQSRAYGAGRLSVRREAGEHLFHRLLYADLRKGLEPAKT